jgi:hypothetical protein
VEFHSAPLLLSNLRGAPATGRGTLYQWNRGSASGMSKTTKRVINLPTINAPDETILLQINA